jgi:hypothetical protein
MNYYEELGVGQDASPEELRQACRTLARLLHPETQTDDKLRAAATREMTRLNEILSVLTEPRKRSAYDLTLRTPVPRQLPVLPGVGFWPGKRRDLARAAIRNWFLILLAIVALATAIAWYVVPVPPEIPSSPPTVQLPQLPTPAHLKHRRPRPGQTHQVPSPAEPAPPAPGPPVANTVLRKPQASEVGFRIRGALSSDPSGIAGLPAGVGSRGLLQFAFCWPGFIRQKSL